MKGTSRILAAGLRGVKSVKRFSRALIGPFGRTARADTRPPACFRASCAHACAQLARYLTPWWHRFDRARPSGTIAGDRGLAARLQALQPQVAILLESEPMMPDSDPLGPKTAVDSGQVETTVIEPVTCLVCGCLCDDIAVVKQGENISAAGNPAMRAYLAGSGCCAIAPTNPAGLPS